mgnify:CR=1 FL=1
MEKLLKYSQLFETATQSTPVASSSDIRVKFTPELEELLRVLEEENSYIAFELLWLNEPDSKYHNGLGIGKVDISKTKSCFDVESRGKVNAMKVENFIKYYFGGRYFQQPDISEFIQQYDTLAGGGELQDVKNKIVPVVVEDTYCIPVYLSFFFYRILFHNLLYQFLIIL